MLATFDNDPLADLEAAQRLPAEQRARMSQVGAWRPAWWSLFFSDDGAADGGAGAGGCGLTVCSATAPAVTWLAHFSNRSLTPLAPPKNPISVSCAAGLSAQVVQGPQGQAVCGAAGAPDPARAGVSGLPAWLAGWLAGWLAARRRCFVVLAPLFLLLPVHLCSSPPCF